MAFMLSILSDSSVALVWVGIVFCLTQSAMFSGLNLALLSLSRLSLETEADQGNEAAARILSLRQDSNLLLCTILWGNVSVNVLLAMLSENALAGVMAFVFSTVGITFFGEIIPQAYFSRNALRVGAKFAPVIWIYRILLYPLAKPCALVLDAWIGPEGPAFFRERELEALLEKHIHEEDSEIGATEGRGALNFLALDDRRISLEGVPIRDKTVIALPTKLDLPVLPDLSSEAGAEFLKLLKDHPRKRHVFTDEAGEPLLVLDTAEFLASYGALKTEVDVYRFCHRPIIVTDDSVKVDEVLSDFHIPPLENKEALLRQDVVLYWTADDKRIITGTDILRNLLSGIARK